MPPRITTRTGISCLPTGKTTATTSPTIQLQLNNGHGRQFTTSTPTPTQHRNRMFTWLNGRGANLKYHIPGSTNYLTGQDDRHKSIGGLSQPTEYGGPKVAATVQTPSEQERELVPKGPKPFPLNPFFISESILSEDLRYEIFRRVRGSAKRGKGNGKSVREVSLELGVDMRRVAAVVRLVELEYRWRGEVSFLFIALFITSMFSSLPFCPCLYDE